MKYEVGQEVLIVNDQPLTGNKVAPPVKVGDKKEIKEIILDKEGNQHLDLGLASMYNFITSYETKEELPRGDKIHWVHPSRVELVTKDKGAEISEVLGKITLAMKEDFDERQKLPNQYVVGYYDKDDNLIGYHADTFCNTTQDKYSAKRYHGENPYDQLATIRKNIDSTLDTTEEKSAASIFGPMSLRIKKEDFKNLSKEEVFISAVYLDDNAPVQRFKFKIT